MTSTGEDELATYILAKGRHENRDDGMSFTEMVAYIAGEPHSDHPRCVCPVITEFCNRWNDNIADDTERTKWMAPFLKSVPGTRLHTVLELQRRELLFDWAFREQLPAALELVPELKSYARAFRDLPPLSAVNAANVFPLMRQAHADHTAAMVVVWATAWGRTLPMAMDVGSKALEPTLWDAACERWRILRRQFMDYFVECSDEAVQALGIQVSKAAKPQLANDDRFAAHLLDRMIQLPDNERAKRT